MCLRDLALCEGSDKYLFEDEAVQTTCRFDHSLENIIPRELCRVCHPELNVSATTRANLYAEDREARLRAAAEETYQLGSYQSAAIAA